MNHRPDSEPSEAVATAVVELRRIGDLIERLVDVVERGAARNGIAPNTSTVKVGARSDLN